MEHLNNKLVQYSDPHCISIEGVQKRDPHKLVDMKKRSKKPVFSRRQWDGLVKAWKIRLHSWENPPSRESQSEPVSESETSFDWSQVKMNVQ